MSGLRVIRRTTQLAPDWWQTQCQICPRRHGRHNAPTEQASDDWWAKHVVLPTHLAVLERDGQPTPEEVVLATIFGGRRDDEKVAPSERDGRLTVRPGHTAYRHQDNPRGDSPDVNPGR